MIEVNAVFVRVVTGKYFVMHQTACAFPANDSIPGVDGFVAVRKKRRRILSEGCDLSLLRGWIKNLEGFLALSLLDDESDWFEVRARQSKKIGQGTISRIIVGNLKQVDLLFQQLIRKSHR
nr:hypothetical protein [Tanacetum cinerariifolium]